MKSRARAAAVAMATAIASGVRVGAAMLVANISALVCLGGLVVLYIGVAGYSKPLANVVLGSLLIVLAVGPYLLVQRHG